MTNARNPQAHQNPSKYYIKIVSFVSLIIDNNSIAIVQSYSTSKAPSDTLSLVHSVTVACRVEIIDHAQFMHLILLKGLVAPRAGLPLIRLREKQFFSDTCDLLSQVFQTEGWELEQ